MQSDWLGSEEDHEVPAPILSLGGLPHAQRAHVIVALRQAPAPASRRCVLIDDMHLVIPAARGGGSTGQCFKLGPHKRQGAERDALLPVDLGVGMYASNPAVTAHRGRGTR
jgi:hypothetical protein